MSTHILHNPIQGANNGDSDFGTPHLLHPLRAALGVLYSLPLSTTGSALRNGRNEAHNPFNAYNAPTPVSPAHAHDFLMHFQTRNARRKLLSLAKANTKGKEEIVGISLPMPWPALEEGDYGSTWMTCLAVLAAAASASNSGRSDSTNTPSPIICGVHYAEALFAAQTLLHRLRRVKLNEAMDLEMEPPLLQRYWSAASGTLSDTASPQTMEALCHHYHYWIQAWHHHHPHSTLGLVLQHYTYQNSSESQEEEEQRFKGQVTMLSLAAIIMDLAISNTPLHSHSHPNSLAHLKPLVATLASALAVTAARLRYTPSSIPNAALHTEPILTMILQAFHQVRHIWSLQKHQQNEIQNDDQVYRWVLYTCLTVLPDALLAGSGSGGGSHGTISMDPRCYHAVTTEIRTLGIHELCQIIANDYSQLEQQLQQTQTPYSFIHMLRLCQEWTKYAPVPTPLLHSTMPALQHILLLQDNSHGASSDPEHQNARGAALGFWIAIMEAGSWTVEMVLSASLLQKQEASQQPHKKKQSNKSKKRQKEVLEERTTAEHYAIAQAEVQHRQDVAVQVAKHTITLIRRLVHNELQGVRDTHDEVAGEGPVGAIVACANACLPYLVRPSSPSTMVQMTEQERLELFLSISSAIHELCQSPSRMVRSFASETLYILHAVVLEVFASEEPPASSSTATATAISSEMATALVNHFYNCCLSLALQCAYPADYFSDLAAQNDEDVENERNDVRDILRTMTGTSFSSMVDGATVHSASPPAQEFACAILSRLVQACSEPILTVAPTENNNPCAFLFPEASIHAFSALSRPLTSLATTYCTSQAGEDLLVMALNLLQTAGQRLTKTIPIVSLSQSLPLARLYNLSVSSLAPMLSILCNCRLQDHVTAVVGVSIEVAMASLLYIPELVATSSLRSSRCDVVGAMRTPGGEDHAACLALMRLATQSKDLSYIFLRAKDNVATELCGLYQKLRIVEHERGRGVYHGKGVLPKSRRILLGLICHLEVVSESAAGASGGLRLIFEASLNEIISLGHNDGITLDCSFFQMIAEHVFDLASFSPGMLRSLFEFSGDESTSISVPKTCVEVLTNLGRFGYDHMFDLSKPLDLFLQWNRLRGALFCLLKASGTPDLPTSSIHPICILIQSECDAIIRQCNLGPDSSSQLFREDLVSEEVVPAGIFIHVINEILEQGTSQGVALKDMSSCIHILCECQSRILEAVLSKCPNPIQKPSFLDPRPMVTEAWVLAVVRLMKGIADTRQSGLSPIEHSLRHNGVECTQAIERLAVDTCVALGCLLLYPSLGRTQEARARDPGMSTDGPHMLVAMEFFQIFFSLGPSLLQAASLALVQKLPVDNGSIQSITNEPHRVGTAIIGAAIFRAAQGGLPPWAVECMPTIYSSLFNAALGQSLEQFSLFLRLSMQVRAGGEIGGELLSGRFFESGCMGETAKRTFESKMLEVAGTNTPVSWKRVKSLIKQACGGKKKDTDFRQRPALTRLDALDRV